MSARTTMDSAESRIDTNSSSGAVRRLAVALIGAYQRWLSPVLPPMCRFYPSCSAYAREAIVQHGLARGLWMAAVRLVKCHPLHPGGFDPVKK